MPMETASIALFSVIYIIAATTLILLFVLPDSGVDGVSETDEQLVVSNGDRGVRVDVDGTTRQLWTGTGTTLTGEIQVIGGLNVEGNQTVAGNITVEGKIIGDVEIDELTVENLVVTGGSIVSSSASDPLKMGTTDPGNTADVTLVQGDVAQLTLKDTGANLLTGAWEAGDLKIGSGRLDLGTSAVISDATITTSGAPCCVVGTEMTGTFSIDSVAIGNRMNTGGVGTIKMGRNINGDGVGSICVNTVGTVNPAVTLNGSNCIVLNAESSFTGTNGGSRFYVNPIRSNPDVSGHQSLYYNLATKEVVSNPSPNQGLDTTDDVTFNNVEITSGRLDLGASAVISNATITTSGAPCCVVGTNMLGTFSTDSVAIGNRMNTGGTGSVKIGRNISGTGAGGISVNTVGTVNPAVTVDDDNCIVLNTGGSFAGTDGADRFYVNPVRAELDVSGHQSLFYDVTTKEVVSGDGFTQPNQGLDTTDDVTFNNVEITSGRLDLGSSPVINDTVLTVTDVGCVVGRSITGSYGENAVVLGSNITNTNSATSNLVAIGYDLETTQLAGSTVVGKRINGFGSNSLVLNASDSNFTIVGDNCVVLNADSSLPAINRSASTFINPVRELSDVSQMEPMFYDTNTKEVTRAINGVTFGSEVRSTNTFDQTFELVFTSTQCYQLEDGVYTVISSISGMGGTIFPVVNNGFTRILSSSVGWLTSTNRGQNWTLTATLSNTGVIFHNNQFTRANVGPNAQGVTVISMHVSVGGSVWENLTGLPAPISIDISEYAVSTKNGIILMGRRSLDGVAGLLDNDLLTYTQLIPRTENLTWDGAFYDTVTEQTFLYATVAGNARVYRVDTNGDLDVNEFTVNSRSIVHMFRQGQALYFVANGAPALFYTNPGTDNNWSQVPGLSTPDIANLTGGYTSEDGQTSLWNSTAMKTSRDLFQWRTALTAVVVIAKTVTVEQFVPRNEQLLVEVNQPSNGVMRIGRPGVFGISDTTGGQLLPMNPEMSCGNIQNVWYRFYSRKPPYVIESTFNSPTNIQLGLGFINQLEPKTFFDNEGKRRHGFIPLDIKALITTRRTLEPTFEFEGLVEESSVLGLNYCAFQAPAIKAIQELHTESQSQARVDFSFRYAFHPHLLDSDAGFGQLWFDNADLSLATRMYVNKQEQGFSSNLRLAQVPEFALVMLQRLSDFSEFAVLHVTGAPTDSITYWRFPVGNHSGATTVTGELALSFRVQSANKLHGVVVPALPTTAGNRYSLAFDVDLGALQWDLLP